MEERTHTQANDADDLYELYCQYAEASRTAILGITISKASRRLIAADAGCMPKDEFAQALCAMAENDRKAFVRRLKIGYDAALAEDSPSLKTRFGRITSSTTDV